MGEVVNLRLARKDKERRLKEAKADENRIRFGASKAERKLATAEQEKRDRLLDGGKIEPPPPDQTD